MVDKNWYEAGEGATRTGYVKDKRIEVPVNYALIVLAATIAAGLIYWKKRKALRHE